MAPEPLYCVTLHVTREASHIKERTLTPGDKSWSEGPAIADCWPTAACKGVCTRFYALGALLPKVIPRNEEDTALGMRRGQPKRSGQQGRGLSCLNRFGRVEVRVTLRRKKPSPGETPAVQETNSPVSKLSSNTIHARQGHCEAVTRGGLVSS